MVEIVGDKFPAVDHALDALSTVLRPAAGSLLAASVMWQIYDPSPPSPWAWPWARRPRSSPTPRSRCCARARRSSRAGLANPVLSLLEDVAAVALFFGSGDARLVAAGLLLVVFLIVRRLARRPAGRIRDVRRLALLAGAALAVASARPLRCRADAGPSPSPPVAPPLHLGVGGGNGLPSPRSSTTRRGKFIGGLGPKDIEVFEDGVRQEVTYFREATGARRRRSRSRWCSCWTPAAACASNMRFLQEAALNFVYKLEDVDDALVVQFNETIKGSAEFTGDVYRLEQFVEALQAWGGTASTTPCTTPWAGSGTSRAARPSWSSPTAPTPRAA